MRFYKVKEVAAIAGLTKHMVRSWCAEHEVALSEGEFTLTNDQLYQLAADHNLVITMAGEDESADAESDEQAEEGEEEEQEA